LGGPKVNGKTSVFHNFLGFLWVFRRKRPVFAGF
jgi:hypothetical protein